jgi:hypothetical protein
LSLTRTDGADKGVVQIAGVGVDKGRLAYTAAVYHEGKPAQIIGPFPGAAYTFVEHGFTADVNTLVTFLTLCQKGH